MINVTVAKPEEQEIKDGDLFEWTEQSEYYDENKEYNYFIFFDDFMFCIANVSRAWNSKLMLDFIKKGWIRKLPKGTKVTVEYIQE